MRHLIVSHRITSFSFVPTVVVQTKDSKSDLWELINKNAGVIDVGDDKGSGWREHLTNSTLQRIKVIEQESGAVLEHEQEKGEGENAP